MANQTITLRIHADASGLVSGVSLAGKETRKLGEEGERAGQKLNSGMGAARRGVQSISTQLEQAKQATIGFASAFVSIQGGRALAALADSWSDMTSRVRLNIDATESASDVMDRLSSIARGTYSSIELTTESFARNAVTLNALGKSTQQQLDYTEALNNALVVSGAKNDAAAMVQDNLSKAMATGSLRGEELNTVLNRGSRIAELLAEELGTNVTGLRDLGAEGKITGDVIYGTLVKNMESLRAEAETMPETIGDAFTLLRNSVLQTVGVFDQQAEVSQGLAESLIVVADNMGTIIKVSVGIGGALVAAHAAATVATLAHEVATRRAAAAALAEAEAQLANLRAKGAGIVATAQLTAAETALAAAQTRATAAGVGQVGMLGKLGGGLMSLAGGGIGLTVIAITALAAALWEITDPGEAARSTLAALRQEIDGSDAAYAALQEKIQGTAQAHVAALVGYRKAQDQLHQLGNELEAARLAQDELIESGKILAGGGLAYGVLELKAKRAADMIADLTEAQDQAIRSALRYAGAVDEQAAAEGRGSSSVKDAVDAYLRAGVEYTTIEGILKSLGVEQAYWLSLINQTPAALNAAAGAGNSYADSLREQLATIGLSQKQMVLYKAAQAAIAAETPAAAAEIQQLAWQVVAKMDAEEAATGAANRHTDAMKESEAQAEAYTASIRDHVRAMIEMEGHASDLAGAESAYKLAVMDAIETANQQVAIGMQWADVERQLAASIDVARQTLDGKTDAINNQVSAADALIADLKFERSTIAMSNVEREIAIQLRALEGELTEGQAEKIRELISGIHAETDALVASADAASGLESILNRFDNIGMSGLVREFDKVKAALEAATDPEKIARLQDALGGLRQEALAYATGALGQGINSLKSMSSEGTKAYAALETAQAALNLATAIGAIANQGMGDPYTAFARIAAMAAMMSQFVSGLGSIRGGFSDTAAQRQESQGTGTVLGDASAKSESISRAIEITARATQQLVGINSGMLRALNAMQAGLGGASTQITRGAGDVTFGGAHNMDLNKGVSTAIIAMATGGIGVVLDLILGGALTKILNKLIGGRSKVTDQGIVIVGGLLSDMIEHVSVGAYQQVQSRSWWFGSTKTSEEVQAIGEGIGAQFQLVLNSMADAVRAGAEALGMNMDQINAAIASYNIQGIRISTMGLSAEEAEAELAAVFASIFDGLVGSVVPFIKQFQQVGEGLGETLIRVATGVMVTQEAIKQLGFSLDETDPEKFAQISESLIGLMGGIDGFIEGMGAFIDAFATDEHKFQVAQDALTSAFAQMGLEVPDSRDAMWDLMQTLDATTESGRAQIAMLLQLADVADSYYQALEQNDARMNALWETYFDLFYSDAEQAQRALENLGASAVAAFGAIGLDSAGFTGDGGMDAFRALFEQALPTLTAEAVTQWLEAAAALGILIDAQSAYNGALADAPGGQAAMAREAARFGTLGEMQAGIADLGLTDWERQLNAIGEQAQKYMAILVESGMDWDGATAAVQAWSDAMLAAAEAARAAKQADILAGIASAIEDLGLSEWELQLKAIATQQQAYIDSLVETGMTLADATAAAGLWSDAMIGAAQAARDAAEAAEAAARDAAEAAEAAAQASRQADILAGIADAIADFGLTDWERQLRDIDTQTASYIASLVETGMGLDDATAAADRWKIAAIAYAEAARRAADEAERLRNAQSLTELLNNLSLDDQLATASDFDASLFQIVLRFRDAIAEAERLGADETALAAIRQFQANAIQRAIEAEQARLAQAEESYQAAVGALRDELDEAGMSEFAIAMRDIGRWTADTIDALTDAARAAGRQAAAEADLGLVHQVAAQRAAAAIAQLRAAAASLVVDIFGPTAGSLEDIEAQIAALEGQSGSGFGAVQDGVADTVGAWLAGLARVRDFLDSLLLDQNLTTLTPEQQLAEAQRQYDELMAAAQAGDSDALNALPDAARSLLDIARGFYSSGDQYQAIFDAVRASMEGLPLGATPGTLPDAGGGGGGYGTIGMGEGDLAALYAERDALLAQQEADHRRELMDQLAGMMRELIQATGDPLADVALSIGLGMVDLAEGLGINLTDMSLETALSLTDLARALGVDLSELGDSVGVSLGDLADDQSLLNQALEAVLATLPDDQSAALQPYLDAIANATTEADANAAIGDMEGAINLLPAGIRDLLAPFFEGVDPGQMTTQLTTLADIRAASNAQLAAAETANAFLDRIAANLGSLAGGFGVPAFAAGGWVNGPTTLLAGESGRELILPNTVSEFFVRAGIPINSGGSDPALVAELIAEVRALRAERIRGDDKVAAAASGAGDRVAGRIDTQTQTQERATRELIAAQPRSR